MCRVQLPDHPVYFDIHQIVLLPRIPQFVALYLQHVHQRLVGHERDRGRPCREHQRCCGNPHAAQRRQRAQGLLHLRIRCGAQRVRVLERIGHVLVGVGSNPGKQRRPEDTSRQFPRNSTQQRVFVGHVGCAHPRVQVAQLVGRGWRLGGKHNLESGLLRVEPVKERALGGGRHPCWICR